MQTQRRGWDFKAEGEDPKIFEQFLDLQKDILNHLMHENTVRRSLNSSAYGNELRYDQVLERLTTSIFTFEPENSPIQQNLQREFVERLIKMAGLEEKSSYPHAGQTIANASLLSIKTRLPHVPAGHEVLLHQRIERALDLGQE